MPYPEMVFKLIAQHTTDLVCLHDKENTIRFSTPSSDAVLGYSQEELKGKKLTDFLTEDFINEMDFSTLMRFFDQMGARIRYQVKHGDGRLRWLETTFTQVQDMEFDDFHVLSTTRDITEGVHLTDDLMAALSKEQELSRLKTNLYSVASHEFKTPLAVIMANIEMLKIKQTPKLLADSLNTMEEEVDNLNLMIGDMLELKKLTSGRRNFNSAQLEIRNIIDDVVSSNRDKWQNEIKVKIKEEGASFKIEGDYSLIRYIFSNLLSNADKFSPENGKVEIHIKYLEDKIEATVTDHGIGIPEEEQAAIFQSFYRAKNVGNVSGTGIGLAITSEFMALHNGKISVKSKPNEGSSFILIFPKFIKS